MGHRLAALGCSTSLAAILLGLPHPFAAASSTRDIGKQIGNFSLKDIHGHAVTLDDFRDKKAIVVIFIGTECPINNAFMPRLSELCRNYSSRGVVFLGINSNQQDTVERMAAHARDYAIPFPVLKDEGNQVADLFEAERTPEAFILDAGRKICYRGRIDDQFGIGYKRPQPTRRDLAIALEEVLAGKPVSQPVSTVFGCYIARIRALARGPEAPPERTVATPRTDSTPERTTGATHGATTERAGGQAAGTVTYCREIVRILQKNCQECHRPGQIGPFSLLTYDDAVAWADTIREVVQEERMPPWYADPRYGHFLNDRRLARQEREQLLAWIDQGMPRGQEHDLPRPRAFAAGWSIGEPELVLAMPQEYAVPADMPKGGIPYQRFRVPTNFKEDRWVERAEVRAGAPSVVHHVIVFIVPPGETFWQGNPRTPVLCGTAPGDMPLILRPGIAKKIPAGSDLVFEMHYTPSGVAARDRSRVGLIFARQPPKFELRVAVIHNPMFRIPPGDNNYKVEQSFVMPRDGYVLEFMPHLHMRGKDFLYEAVYPDGKKQILLSVPHYNFNWQSIYRLEEPIFLPRGTKIHCVAHFDNSARNPNNPDPTAEVRWGEQTWQEMMIGWADLIFERKASE
jgi:peroxiredoxin/mono/diheme cytochrome c family protein